MADVDISQWTPFNQSTAETISFDGTVWDGSFSYRVDRVESYQVASPEGQTGSTSKYLGQEEREIQIEATITTAEEYVQWMQITEVVFAPPKRGTKAKAVWVQHPELNHYYRIFEVNLIRASNPQPDGTLRRRKATMTLREQAPPRVTQAKVGGANPDNKKDDDPQLTAYQLEQNAVIAGNQTEIADYQSKINAIHRRDVDRSASNNP